MGDRVSAWLITVFVFLGGIAFWVAIISFFTLLVRGTNLLGDTRLAHVFQISGPASAIILIFMVIYMKATRKK